MRSGGRAKDTGQGATDGDGAVHDLSVGTNGARQVIRRDDGLLQREGVDVGVAESDAGDELDAADAHGQGRPVQR
jgi:hypothetical protein